MTPSCLCLVPFFPLLYVIVTLSITCCPTKDLVSGSRCVCPPGFSGKHCQIGPSPCDSTPCLHGGQCMEKDGRTITCNCPPGYSGLFCEVGQLPWCQCENWVIWHHEHVVFDQILTTRCTFYFKEKDLDIEHWDECLISTRSVDQN